MRGRISFRAVALALVVTVVGAAGIAAVAGARNADITVTAKLAPNVGKGGEPANFKTTFTNNKSSTTHLVSTTSFPSGTTIGITAPASPTCTTSGTLVTCDFGQVAAGVTKSVEIVATPEDVANANWEVVQTWGFYDVKGQGGNAQSTDNRVLKRAIPIYSSADGSVDSTCLPNTGGALSALKDGSAISMDTPGLTSGLCIPAAVQVVAVNKLMSFAPPFSPDDPGQLVLTFVDGKMQDTLFYSVVDGGPSIEVPLCSETPVSATVPACEQGRSSSGGVLSINVDWTGDDPFWNL